MNDKSFEDVNRVDIGGASCVDVGGAAHVDIGGASCVVDEHPSDDGGFSERLTCF